MVIEVFIRDKHGIRRLFALMDTGAQGNFLSQKVALEEGWQADPSSMGAMAVDGHNIPVYGQYTVDIDAVDSKKESRTSNIKFIATDIKRYDAILGWP